MASGRLKSATIYVRAYTFRLCGPQWLDAPPRVTRSPSNADGGGSGPPPGPGGTIATRPTSPRAARSGAVVATKRPTRRPSEALVGGGEDDDGGDPAEHQPGQQRSAQPAGTGRRRQDHPHGRRDPGDLQADAAVMASLLRGQSRRCGWRRRPPERRRRGSGWWSRRPRWWAGDVRLVDGQLAAAAVAAACVRFGAVTAGWAVHVVSRARVVRVGVAGSIGCRRVRARSSDAYRLRPAFSSQDRWTMVTVHPAIVVNSAPWPGAVGPGPARHALLTPGGATH